MHTSLAIVAATALAASADAFIASPNCNVAAAARSGCVRMSATESRRMFVAKSAIALAELTSAAQGASAANYFGDKDAYPEVVKPSEAVKDADKLKEVASKIDTIRAYKSAVVDLQAELDANAQSDLRPKMRKAFEFSKLRTTLNEVNVVFDEDSQRGTDRLIRAILQDAVEFEDAARIKQGVPRSPRKVAVMKAKLAKMDKAFADLLAFF